MYLIGILSVIVIVPLISYFPKFFIYFIIFESVLDFTILPEYLAVNERQMIAVILLIRTIMKYNFKLNKIFPINKINILLLLFFIWVGVSFTLWGHPRYGRGEFLTLGYCLIMYILIHDNFQSKREVQQLISFFIFSGIVLALFSLSNYNPEIYVRLRSSREPNATAIAMIILLPFLLQKDILNGLLWRVLKIPIISFLIFSILLTGSMTGFVGLSIVLLLSFILNNDIKYRVQIVSFILAGGLIALLIFEFSNISFPQRLQSFIFSTQTELAYGNFQYRLLRVKAGLAMFQLNPIFGVGAGNYVLYAPIWGVSEQAAGYSAHNEYVRLIAEFGLIGGLIYGLLVFYVFRLLFKSLKLWWFSPLNDRNQNIIYPFLNALSISFVSLLVMNLTLNSLLFSANTYIFIALIQNLTADAVNYDKVQRFRKFRVHLRKV